MMSSLWAGLVVLALALWAVIGPWLGHRVGKSGKDQAVNDAKTDAAATAREEVAASTAAAAGQAMKNAGESRASSVRVAHATAVQGDDALNAALKAQGALRD